MASGDAALDEYRQLRDEKAADWRLITQTTVATLATSGAVFAAGLSVHSLILIVLAPIPLYLGVGYMLQSAQLQMRLIAFLGSRAPPGSLNYEKHIVDSSNDPEVQQFLPSWTKAWLWWRGVATAVGLGFSCFPFVVRLEHLKGFEQTCPALYTALGLVLTACFFLVSRHLSKQVMAARTFWVDYWSRDGPDEKSSSQTPNAPAA